jgi:transcriptional regulator with GAF, ATPase, and Fis domain
MTQRRKAQRQADASERRMLERALKKTIRARWNVTAAAAALGMPLSTMKHKMKRLKVRQKRS